MRTRLTILTAVLLCVGIVAVALAHGGGIDGSGGHNNRKQGDYHFHRGPLAGSSYASKADALAALQGQQQESKPTKNTTLEKTTATEEDKIDAVIRLLIQKGVITEQELRRELSK